MGQRGEEGGQRQVNVHLEACQWRIRSGRGAAYASSLRIRRIERGRMADGGSGRVRVPSRRDDDSAG